MTEPATNCVEQRTPPNAEILSVVREVLANQRDLDHKLSAHMVEETKEIADMIAKLSAAAFPAGDPGGHRRHHELVIKAAEERAEFWSKMRVALGQYGLLGFAGWAFYALWNAFLQGPHK